MNIDDKLLKLMIAKLLSFMDNKLFFGWQITIPALNSITIPRISPKKQKLFINLVDQILSITKDKDYLENQEKQNKVKEIEKEIDKMVYELYELTPKEIKVVENFNKN